MVTYLALYGAEKHAVRKFSKIGRKYLIKSWNFSMCDTQSERVDVYIYDKLSKICKMYPVLNCARLKPAMLSQNH